MPNYTDLAVQLRDPGVEKWLDFDDICVEFVKPALDWHNRTYGTTTQYQKFSQYDLGPHWGVDRTTKMARILEFHRYDGVGTVVPFAKQVVELFARQGAPRVVTGRHMAEDMPWITHQQRQHHFGTLLCPVVAFCHHNCLNGTPPRRKSEVIRADSERALLIEDLLSTAIDCGREGITVVLYDRPWNQCPDSDLPSNVYRLDGMEDVLELMC